MSVRMSASVEMTKEKQHESEEKKRNQKSDRDVS